jgi:UDP-glucose 4-epimerase
MKFSNDTPVMVLGANGYIGKNLCIWLLQNHYKVIAVGRAESFAGAEAVNCRNLIYVRADLFEQTEINRLPFTESKIIFLMNGKTGTSNGFDEPIKYLLGNDVTLLNILRSYVEQNARGRLIFPSTRLVYQGVENTFLNEDAIKSPKTVYGINKLSCEKYLTAWSNAYDLPFTVFRICIPYGQLVRGDYSYGTTGMMLDQAKNKGVITLFGDGSIKRTFTHIADICKIMSQVAQLDDAKNQIINIGGPDNISLLDLAQIVARKYKAKIEFIKWPSIHLRIESGDTIFNDSLLKKIYKFTYERNLIDYFHGDL